MLSVVIPTRDTEVLTLECLDSLVRHGPEELEVIVVDDGGRDGTAPAIRQRFPGVVMLCEPTPKGFTAAANRGLGQASGDPVLLLNSDTRVTPGALQRLAAAFAKHPRLGVAGARLEYPDGRQQWSHGSEPGLLWLFLLSSGLGKELATWPAYGTLRRALRTRVAGDHPEEPRATGWVTGAALAIRRQVLIDLSLLDEGFELYAQDLDFCLRAKKAGWEVAVLPEVRIIHHQGSTVAATFRCTSFEGQRLETLWWDLLRWSAKWHRSQWATAARASLLLGVRLRLLVRQAARPFLAGGGRRGWDRDTRHLQRALLRLRRRLAEA